MLAIGSSVTHQGTLIDHADCWVLFCVDFSFIDSAWQLAFSSTSTALGVRAHMVLYAR